MWVRSHGLVIKIMCQSVCSHMSARRQDNVSVYVAMCRLVVKIMCQCM